MPALALLGQAVGVDPGERPDQGRLAVVDVAGGPERQRRPAHPRRQRSADRRRHERRPRPRSACADPAPGGRRGRERSRAARRRAAGRRSGRLDLGRQGDRRTFELGQGQRAAADPGGDPDHLGVGADRASPGAGRGLPARPRRPRAWPEPESRGARHPGRGSASASPPGRPARACRCAGPGPTGGARAAAIASAVPSTSPACGPPSSLSPEQQTRAAPAAIDAFRSGSSPSAAEPVASASTPEPMSSMTGTPKPGQRLEAHIGDEALGAEVGLVHAQDRPHRQPAGDQRALVVLGMGAVGRPDLDHRRARLRDHVRDPKAPADLDQLAAGDDHRTARPGQGGHGQEHRAGAVVDHHRSLRAGQFAQQVGDVIVTRAPLARRQIELEVGVARRPRGPPRLGQPRPGARGRGWCG